MSTRLAAAPEAVVDAVGHPRFGAYEGFLTHSTWDGLRAPHARAATWTRLHRKRWQYAGIMTSDVVAAVAIVDVGWAANAFAYVFDRRTRTLLADTTVMGVSGLSAQVSESAGSGVTRFRGLGLTATCEAIGPRRWQLTARGRKGLAFDITLDGTGAPPTLCVVAPIAGGVGNATHKTVGVRVTGTVTAGGTTFTVDGGSGLLDHTSGLLGRDTQWHWAAATGPGLGLNLSSGFMGSSENAFFLGDRVQVLGPAEFRFDRARPLEPWHLRTGCGRLALTFTPEGLRAQRKNFGVALSDYVQPIGRFDGTVRVGEETVAVNALAGVTEDHVARW